MTKLETIRKACISANKSILDLKFGCEVLFQNETYIFLTGDKTIDNWFKVILKNNNEGRMFLTYSEEYKIIGRPIKLSDVVLIDEFSSSRYVILDLWDKRNDNLEKQHPKTIDFIYNLIK